MFSLNTDQTAILEMVRDFCKSEIAPLAAQYDRSSEFPWEQLKALGKIGLLGAMIPEELGGSELDV
jgi:alkylation response protein AidB-like acyl-CoA dehydrogenase